LVQVLRNTEPTGPRPPIVNTAKVVYLTALTADPARIANNIFHFQLGVPANPLTNAQMVSLASQTLPLYASFVSYSLTSGAKVLAATATALDGSGAQGVATGSTVGGDPGQPLPPQCAVGVTWKAAFSWRGGRPRTYLPFVTNNALNSPGDSTLSASWSGNVASHADAFISACNLLTIGSQSVTLGFVSYFHNYAFRTPPLFYFYTQGVVHERMDSQRRRSGKESAFPVHA
jgi:hypothetical protein